MSSLVGRCSAITGAAVALSFALLLVGVPGAVLLGLAPIAICVGIAIVTGGHDPDGKHLAETARRGATHHGR